MEKELGLFGHQEDFVNSTSRHTGLIAGYGAGKSFAGVLKTCQKLSEVGECAYYLPTYGLLRDIAFPKFTEILNLLNWKFELKRSDKDIETSRGVVHLRSMDNPDSIIGYEVGYSLIDETDILPKDKMSDVFGRIIARNRKVLKSGINQTDVVGTPEGFKWAYDFFIKNDSPDKRLINAKTTTNTFLPKDYVKSLTDNYSHEQLKAYLEGEFINLTSGQVYKMFDRQLNKTTRALKPGEPLFVGMDFNVTNMAATIAVKEGDKLFVIDEIVGAYDTHAMTGILQDRHPGHSMTVLPDAAGAARSSGGKSDHVLLREAGFTVRAPKRNPFIKDRVNSVNTAFMNKKLLINFDKCPELVSALEQQVYNKAGDPDKTQGVDHELDSLGYLVTGVEKSKPIRMSFSY